MWVKRSAAKAEAVPGAEAGVEAEAEAWVGAGGIAAVPVVQASLSADHRVSDGHVGSAFLVELAAQLQRPEEL